MPFVPTRNPGVASAWTANSAVIVENAVPIRIARPSRARAPATLSGSDASEVERGGAAHQPEVQLRRAASRARVPTSATSDDRARARASSATATTSRDRDMAGISAAPAENLSRRKVVLTNTLTSLYCPAPERVDERAGAHQRPGQQAGARPRRDPGDARRAAGRRRAAVRAPAGDRPGRVAADAARRDRRARPRGPAAAPPRQRHLRRGAEDRAAADDDLVQRGHGAARDAPEQPRRRPSSARAPGPSSASACRSRRWTRCG